MRVAIHANAKHRCPLSETRDRILDDIWESGFEKSERFPEKMTGMTAFPGTIEMGTEGGHFSRKWSLTTAYEYEKMINREATGTPPNDMLP